MLNYIATEPYVQLGFLALIAFIIGIWFLNRTREKLEKNDFKREEVRHKWSVEDQERKRNLPVPVEIRSYDDNS
jgi:hypothetical protein